jgi:hypothetical protein
VHSPLTAASQLALFAEAPKRRRKKPVPVPLPSSLLTVRCRCDSQLVYSDEDGTWCPRCGRKKKAAR